MVSNGEKRKKYIRREEEGDENEAADADEEEIESWLHRLVGAQLPRNSDEAFNFFFSILNAKRER